jgi:hypothetical protein
MVLSGHVAVYIEGTTKVPTAKRLVRNPSGYHSSGKSPKEKVHNFAMFIKPFGWTGKWRIDEDSHILHLNATRDDNEKIDIEWPESQWWPDVWYTFAGATIKCRNISHAAKIAQAEPDPERMRRVSRRRFSGGKAASLRGARRPGERLSRAEGRSDGPNENDAGEAIVAALKGYVPFTHESTAEEVDVELKSYKVPTITWVNRMTGAVHTTMIKTRSKHFRITKNGDGKVIINFTDEFGFHAVYANSVIGVA